MIGSIPVDFFYLILTCLMGSIQADFFFYLILTCLIGSIPADFFYLILTGSSIPTDF